MEDDAVRAGIPVGGRAVIHLASAYDRILFQLAEALAREAGPA